MNAKTDYVFIAIFVLALVALMLGGWLAVWNLV